MGKLTAISYVLLITERDSRRDGPVSSEFGGGRARKSVAPRRGNGGMAEGVVPDADIIGASSEEEACESGLDPQSPPRLTMVVIRRMTAMSTKTSAEADRRSISVSLLGGEGRRYRDPSRMPAQAAVARQCQCAVTGATRTRLPAAAVRGLRALSRAAASRS